MTKLIKTIFLASALASIVLNCSAQQKTPAPLGKNVIGINASYHFLPDRNPIMIGATYERGFTRHSGIEAGLINHSLKTTTEFYTNGSLQYVTRVREYYTNIPILYKYYSNIVNIAAGPSINVLTGWKQIGNSEVKVTSMKSPPRIGYQIKLSKSFEPVENFIIEPEVRMINLSVHYIRQYGIGLGIKYRL